MYINGILFNLLGEREIRDVAIEMDMKEALNRISHHADYSLKNQFDLLLEKLKDGIASMGFSKQFRRN